MLALLMVSVVQVVYFHHSSAGNDVLQPLPNNVPDALRKSLAEWKLEQTRRDIKQDEKKRKSISSSSSSNITYDNPLLQVLYEAGIDPDLNLTAQERAQLPTVWSHIQEIYGKNLTKPVIWGLETCQEYRRKVPKEDRYTAVAGLFNTGTNAMDHHLSRNLLMPSKWQVPWGKHRVPWVRLNHTAPRMNDTNPEFALPVVMIRDPFHFLQSMCKNPYAARWRHRARHCPNLVPDAQDWEMFHSNLTASGGKFNVTVHYDKDQKFAWDSLIHFYNDWYMYYWKTADYPRLFVRFEDMLLFAPAVMEQIANCVEAERPETFRYQVTAAKHHGSGNGLLDAIFKTGSAEARFKSMSKEDVAYAVDHLDKELMGLMQYSLPSATGKTAS